MTTASNSAVIDQTTDAAFRTWVADVIAQLAAVGLTQTADTGQINTATVVRAAVINTAAGYSIWRFNDTLQATSPIFFKLEFGTGGTQPTNPQMFISVGQGSDGAGNLTGTISTRRAVLWGGVQISTVTAYTSRYCYNTTQGFFGMVFKSGGVSVSGTNAAMGTLIIMRTNDSAGAPVSNGVAVLASSNTATGVGNAVASGFMDCYSYTSSALSVSAVAQWHAAPGTSFIFNLSTSLAGGVAYIAPVYTIDPVIRFSANLGVALLTELPLGTTAVFAIIGSTTHTFIGIGLPFGCTSGFQNQGSGTTGMLMLWE